jgi:hypothetical protein
MADLDVIRKLTRNLMDQYGLTNWTFAFDRARNRAGYCNRTRKQISLSGPLMSIWPQDACQMVILHEIAHALTTGHHTAEWRRTFVSMGGDGRTCWDSSDGRPQLPPKYTGKCPNGHPHTRERKPAPGLSCNSCSHRYNPRYLITWTRNN